MRRLWRILGLALLGTTLIASPILAAIDSPDTLTINNIYAFQSVVEDNDQLYIASFEISYTSNTTPVADDAGANFLFRLSDNGSEVATATPYAFYNRGYDKGVIGFYFSADDANLPTWSSTTLELELLGNPSLDWGGDPPAVSCITVTSWNTAKVLVAAIVRTLGLNLEASWTTPAIDLIAKVQGINKLTSEGEDYFQTVIPNLKVISPELFISTVTNPDFPTENRTTTYGDTVETRWTTSGNSTFDMSNIATLFHTSNNWVMAMLYIGFCMGILLVGSYKISEIRTGQGSLTAIGLRPVLFLFGALMIAGSFLGFMPFEIGLFTGILGGLSLVLALFWRGSP